MEDAKTPTASLAFLARCLNRMAIGRSSEVARGRLDEEEPDGSRSREVESSPAPPPLDGATGIGISRWREASHEN